MEDSKYCYDANGNMTKRGGSTVSWYSYNLPNVINGPSGSSQFFYGPDRARYKQVADYAGTAETTLYVSGLLEKVTRGGITEYKHYIQGGSDTTVIYVRRSSGNLESTLYVSKDHLGSSSAITVGSGALAVNLSFGAFGQRRGTNWSGSPSASNWTQITGTTRHGFTGHEHLDNLSLIHMNGRVYDPYIGRFLSADPLIQSPFNTGMFNRYSYTINNFLKFIDPSGFAMCGSNSVGKYYDSTSGEWIDEYTGTIDKGCWDRFNAWVGGLNNPAVGAPRFGIPVAIYTAPPLIVSPAVLIDESTCESILNTLADSKKAEAAPDSQLSEAATLAGDQALLADVLAKEAKESGTIDTKNLERLGKGFAIVKTSLTVADIASAKTNRDRAFKTMDAGISAVAGRLAGAYGSLGSIAFEGAGGSEALTTAAGHAQMANMLSACMFVGGKK